MVIILFLGVFFAFLGYTPPSVLNMTALKIRLQRNNKQFNQYIFGVLIIVFLQAYFAVFIAEFLKNNPSTLILIKKLGTFIFIILSVYFFTKHKQDTKPKKTSKQLKHGSFFEGVILSSLNVFAIPFFYGIIVFLTTFNLMNNTVISIVYFVLGSVIGTFLILYLYGKYANLIVCKTKDITQNINLILSIITLIFAMVTFVKFVV